MSTNRELETRRQAAVPRGMGSATAIFAVTCGVYGNLARILVPLTASETLVDEGLGILEQSLEEALAA
jgi:4-aminobutyrate aminotransferase-like enzyme